MAYGDQKFRHDLRNIINSLLLALRAYDVCDTTERVELLDMMVRSADEAIHIIDANPPEADAGVGT